MLLAKRSDDNGKPVWGNIGRSDRSVRRYRAEAEDLGYVTVYRSKPERGPSGRWSRRKANSYYLRLPAQGTAQLDALAAGRGPATAWSDLTRPLRPARLRFATIGGPLGRVLTYRTMMADHHPYGVRQPPPHPP